jgi:CRP-like cAMP-binding protein
MKDIATQNITLHQRIEITSGKTTREKLLKYLNVQSRRLGSNSFVIPFDRQELADYLGVDRSGLSNEISKLRDEGLIKCERNRFELIV